MGVEMSTGIDALDPKRAHVALAHFAVSILCAKQTAVRKEHEVQARFGQINRMKEINFVSLFISKSVKSRKYKM